MKYLKEILVLISLVIILLGCSPTTQVVCGTGQTDGTLSNVETPRVEVLDDVQAAVQSPGTDQSVQVPGTVQNVDTE